MGKNPGYLPESAWTVGAMIDDQLQVTWTCDVCKAWGQVDLLRIASRRGIDYCLVDRKTRCRDPVCKGVVGFHYSAGRGTPTRPLEANRERQDAAKARAAAAEMEAARQAYNRLALKNGALPLPAMPDLTRKLIQR